MKPLSFLLTLPMQDGPETSALFVCVSISEILNRTLRCSRAFSSLLVGDASSPVDGGLFDLIFKLDFLEVGNTRGKANVADTSILERKQNSSC